MSQISFKTSASHFFKRVMPLGNIDYMKKFIVCALMCTNFARIL